MIPLFVDVPMKRVPWANWALIAITVVVSLAVPAERRAVYDLPGSRAHESADIPNWAIRTELSPLVLQPDDFHAYQLVTCLFQHAGLIHLFGNMLFLFVFGNPINAKLGHLSFLAAYLGIGSLESLIWLALGPGVPCLGASAAIMGICGMFLILYPRNEVSVWDDFLMWWQGDWTPSLAGWVVVLTFLAFDVWGSLFQWHSGVAYSAHVFGFLLGVASAVGLIRAKWLKTDIGEQTMLDWLAGRGPREKKRRRYRKLPKPHPDVGIKPSDDVPRL